VVAPAPGSAMLLSVSGGYARHPLPRAGS